MKNLVRTSMSWSFQFVVLYLGIWFVEGYGNKDAFTVIFTIIGLNKLPPCDVHVKSFVHLLFSKYALQGGHVVST